MINYPKTRKPRTITKYNKIYFITNDLAKDKKQIESFFKDNMQYSYVKKVNNFKYTNFINGQDVDTIFININIDYDKRFDENELDDFACKVNAYLGKNYKFYYKNYERTVRFSTSKINELNEKFNTFLIDDTKTNTYSIGREKVDGNANGNAKVKSKKKEEQDYWEKPFYEYDSF